MGYDGKPVDMYIRPDMGTFNQIIVVTPPGLPGNSPIRLPGDAAHAPGSPFIITAVNASLYQYGTSCSNLANYVVSINYTGDVSVKTIDIYTSHERDAYLLWGSSLPPYDTFIIEQNAYWKKLNPLRTIRFYVEETGNASNNATSDERSFEGIFCGY